MRDGRSLALAVAVVAASSCARCARTASPPPERLVPAAAAWAVVVPKLRALQDQASPALRTVLGFPAAAEVGEALAAVRGQLGFDPLDPGALAGAGIDPEGGAALAAAPEGPPLVVLPTSDGDRLDAMLARVARDRLGAARRDAAEVNGTRVTSFRRAAGAAPALSFARAGGATLVAPGEAGPRTVAAAAALTGAASLGASAAYAKARGALGDGTVVLAFAPAGSPALARVPPARDGAAVGVLASATSIEIRTALLLPSPRAEVWREALPEGASRAGADALARLPADTFLAMRSGADPAIVARRASYVLSPEAAATLSRAGLDLERDVGGALAPGAAVGIALAPTFQVAAASRLDMAERNPFQLVHLAAVLEVKDGDRLTALFERLARAGPALGWRVEPRSAGGLPGWRAVRGGTEIAFALDGKRLYAAGGPGRLDALLARSAVAYAAPTTVSRTALDGAAAAVVIDFGRLVRSFRALPAEAYGSGPDAFVMRSLAERVVDPAARLAAASVRLDGAAGAVRLDVVVEAAGSERR